MLYISTMARPRLGRPKTLRSGVLMAFRMEKRDLARLRRLASRNGTTPSEVVRRLIAAELQRDEKRRGEN